MNYRLDLSYESLKKQMCNPLVMDYIAPIKGKDQADKFIRFEISHNITTEENFMYVYTRIDDMQFKSRKFILRPSVVWRVNDHLFSSQYEHLYYDSKDMIMEFLNRCVVEYNRQNRWKMDKERLGDLMYSAPRFTPPSSTFKDELEKEVRNWINE